MQAELNSDVALSAANALLSHLRKNPEAASQPARDLAASFGLDEAFVAQVLQNIHSNRRPESRSISSKPSAATKASEWLIQIWFRVTDRPSLFVAATFILGIAGIYVGNFVMPILFPSGAAAAGRAEAFSPGFVAKVLVDLGIVGAVFCVHMGVYFRHRRSRYALHGGLILFVILMVSWGIAFAFGDVTEAGMTNIYVMYVVMLAAMLTLSMMYAGVGSLASVLGGWTRIKLQDRADETMSRQDLLERYFELQNRLAQSAYPRAATSGAAIFSSPSVRWYRRYQFPVNIGIGLLSGLLRFAGLSATGIQPGRVQINGQINYWLVPLMLLGIATYLCYVLQGYLSKSGWRAALGAICLAIAGQLPLFAYIREGAQFSQYLITEAVQILIYVGMSCGAYLGAVVQNRGAKEASLQGNDQATLLAEMVRIQWRLSNESAAVCVMVVDAAGSSVMKASANPLMVEYSFREYQEWISKICSARGGRVHSTAGDGAVVAFATPDRALESAREIQADLNRFNESVNRLSQPFRLRIGLHTGEVAGDINEVQFTEVIDIAAHVESVCPIGGIAVTEDFVVRLTHEAFVDLGTVIDSRQVYTVKNLTKPAP